MENPFPECENVHESDQEIQMSTSESESSERSTDEGTSTVSTTIASSTSSSMQYTAIVRLPKMSLPTFKIVGDNINKYVKPTEMTMDAQAKTLDFFNLYAVCDQVSMSGLDDLAAIPNLSSCKVEEVLPTAQDHEDLIDNFTYIFTRVLKRHVPFVKKYAAGLDKHTKHQYYDELSQKSEVVCIHTIGYIFICVMAIYTCT